MRKISPKFYDAKVNKRICRWLAGWWVEVTTAEELDGLLSHGGKPPRRRRLRGSTKRKNSSRA